MQSSRPSQVPFHQWISARNSILLIAVGTMLAADSTPVVAQPPSQAARRQFVESLLKSLIQSQLDPQRPPPNRPAPPRPDERLTAARKHLDEFSTHSAQLVNHWNANVHRAPGTRQMVGDLIKLNASVTNLRTRAAAVRQVDDLVPDFVALDRDWRLMSHRMKQIDGLSPECSRCIGRLNEVDTALCELLDVSPQVDFHALVAATLAVNTSLDHLIEDIELELPRSRVGRNLIAEAAQVQQRALLLSDVVSQRRSYEQIVDRFRTFHGPWQNLAAKIRQVDSRHLERNVRRVEELSHTIHELLWLAEQVDYGRLSHLVNSLRRDVDGMFDTVSLNVLLELPASTRVLPVASEFYGLCENFTNSVESRASLHQLQSDYRFLIETWPELSGCFRPCRNPDVVQSLKGIEESFVALRDAVGLAAPIDWHHGNEVAAALVLSADTVVAEVQSHVFNNARYNQQLRFESARDAAAFRGAARRLHEAIVNRQADLLGERAQMVADAWAEFDDHCFQRLVPADQQHLRELRIPTTRQIVELQAMFQL